jgi:hypothetical protein
LSTLERRNEEFIIIIAFVHATPKVSFWGSQGLLSRKLCDVSNDSLLIYLQARPLLSQALDTGYLQGLIDPMLEKNFNEVEMFRMIEAAAACIRHSASRRPRMSQVHAKSLREDINI